jgi:predicted nuclease with TOPRIM domain
MRSDIDYLHNKWRQEHNIQSVLYNAWYTDDQKAYDYFMVKVDAGSASEEIETLLQACDRLRAQRHETKQRMESLERSNAMQREILKELMEENERLKLSVEMAYQGVGRNG